MLTYFQLILLHIWNYFLIQFKCLFSKLKWSWKRLKNTELIWGYGFILYLYKAALLFPWLQAAFVICFAN